MTTLFCYWYLRIELIKKSCKSHFTKFLISKDHIKCLFMSNTHFRKYSLQTKVLRRQNRVKFDCRHHLNSLYQGNSVYSSTWQQMLFNRSVCTKPSDIKEPWVQKCSRESFRRKKEFFSGERKSFRNIQKRQKGSDKYFQEYSKSSEMIIQIFS